MSDHNSNPPLVLVTGGAGFIGSHLVRRLLRDGYYVRVLDNLATGKAENLAEVADRIDFVQGSVADLSDVQRAVAGAAYILHEAAVASVPQSVRDPLGNHQVNATGTMNLLEAARQAGVRRLVFAASSAAYGNAPDLPKLEAMADDPISPYAAAKVASEHYCRCYWRVYGFETVCLRYFNVYGPRQDPLSEYAAVIPRFITALLEDRDITIYGDGEQSRDFTYVDDVAEANLLALTAAHAPGEIINVACGERFTLNGLVATLSGITGRGARVTHQPERTGDVKHSMANIDKARQLLGYQPRVSFEEGLRRTVEYFQSLQ